MNGSKSATTTTSKRHYFNPGVDFSYKIATRTFSRKGVRPATCPAKKNSAFSSEDAVATAQSSNIQKNFGETLMMLGHNLPKVRPEKFLELKAIMNQPNTFLTSPISRVSTPHLVKVMIERAKTAESLQSGSMQRSNQTRNGYRSRVSKSSSSASQSKHYAVQRSDISEEEYRSSLSYSKFDDYPQRCVRCAGFPDIQIEGKSLNRILTNKNVLMSREHCEVLGAYSCPDCVRVRSQTQHDHRCNKNNPAVPNDIYKIALVHENSPNMSKKEVQRKIFDGEISDKLLTIPYWKQAKSQTQVNQDQSHETPIQKSDKKETFLPFIDAARSSNSISGKSTRESSTQKSNSDFETVLETLQAGNDSENYEEKSRENLDINSNENETKELSYQRHSAEEPMAVQVVPASEVSRDNDDLGSLAQTKLEISRRLDESSPPRTKKVIKVEAENQTEMNFGVVPVEMEKHKNKNCFTLNVIPSKNFFFDISDLADRIRKSGIMRSKRSESRIRLNFLYSNSANRNQAGSVASSTEEKVETNSVSSNDSLHPLKDFSMSYEPPFFFDYKGKHFGGSSTISRRSSVASKA